MPEMKVAQPKPEKGEILEETKISNGDQPESSKQEESELVKKIKEEHEGYLRDPKSHPLYTNLI